MLQISIYLAIFMVNIRRVATQDAMHITDKNKFIDANVNISDIVYRRSRSVNT